MDSILSTAIPAALFEELASPKQLSFRRHIFSSVLYFHSQNTGNQQTAHFQASFTLVSGFYLLDELALKKTLQ